MGVDVVFHLANIAHVGEPDRALLQGVNVRGTESVCRASVAASVPRLIYFSSVLAKDPSASPYAESKRDAEAAVLSAGNESAGKLHVTVLRPANTYGPHMKGNLAAFIKRISRGRIPPLPRLRNRIALVSVTDLCRIAIAAAEGGQKSGEIYTLTDGEGYTPSRIEAAVYHALGRQKPNWATPLVIFYIAAMVAQLASWFGLGRNNLGLRTFRNLVKDEPVNVEGFVRELGVKPSHTLESTLPEILRSIEVIE